MAGQEKELRFDTGVADYSLNGRYTVSFNPTDVCFFEQIYALIERLDEKQEKLEAAVKNDDVKAMFSLHRRRDGEMRAELDALLGAGCCESVFGAQNVFSYSDGFPVWLNLLFALIDEAADASVRERRKTNPRIEKYTKKYHRQI